MDIDTQCLSVFKSFVSDIIKVFPEYKLKLEDVYGSLLSLDSCKIEEQEVLGEFLERVHKYNKQITNKDESLFTQDPLFLTDLSFKHMWSTNISFKTKETIWKYLQTFCLLALNRRSNQDLQNALTSLSENKDTEIKDKHIASDVKKIKQMTQNIQEPIPEDLSPEPEPAENPMSQIEGLMGNSEIGKIAQEITQTLDLESMLGESDSDNPFDIFQKLMNGDTMGKIMNTIHTTVTEKVENGEIDQQTMVNQAQNMYQSMGDNPMFQAMNQQMGQTNSTPQETKRVIPQNKTQARLQKKLKEKKMKQSNKIQVTKKGSNTKDITKDTTK